MKALILGANGQVGRALAATAPAGMVVTALPRAQCDLTDEAGLRAIIVASDTDVVLNAAAYTAVDLAETETALAEAINGRAPGWIAEVCSASGKRFVHISTDFVFDGRSGSPYRPGDATNPASVYGRTKRQGELAVAAAASDHLIVRTSWVHASRGKNFVLTMLRLMAANDRVRVVADQVGSPTWSTSLSRGIWGALNAGGKGILHITDAGVASWYDFAVAIAEEAHAIGLIPSIPAIIPIATSDYPTPAARPAYSVLDKSETWALLGETAPHWRNSLRDMLKECALHG